MPRLDERLAHIKDAIGDIRTMVADRTFDDVQNDRKTRLALERCLEIVSEASRHIPEAMKAAHGPSVPWRQVADVGNVLRHAYHRGNFKALWAIYTDDLGELEAAINAMITERGSQRSV